MPKIIIDYDRVQKIRKENIHPNEFLIVEIVVFKVKHEAVL